MSGPRHGGEEPQAGLQLRAGQEEARQDGGGRGSSAHHSGADHAGEHGGQQ